MIDDYLNNLPPDQKAALQYIREIITQLVPDAKEGISYDMPGFKYKGKYLAGYAAFKNHLSLFPTPAPIEAYKDQLQDFVLSKGTIQFTLAKPLSRKLIELLIKYRVQQIDSSS